jgi:hypothetical protein
MVRKAVLLALLFAMILPGAAVGFASRPSARSPFPRVLPGCKSTFNRLGLCDVERASVGLAHSTAFRGKPVHLQACWLHAPAAPVWAGCEVAHKGPDPHRTWQTFVVLGHNEYCGHWLTWPTPGAYCVHRSGKITIGLGITGL